MKTTATTIKVLDVTMEVTYNYSPYRPAITNADPYDCREAEGGVEEVLEVIVGGQDIYNLLSDYALTDIWEALNEELRGKR
jgi:hypothetical protein